MLSKNAGSIMMKYSPMTPPNRAGVALLALAVVAASGDQSATQLPPHGRLFPPQELGLLEGPDRDAWQKPEQIMDALGIADGSVVADLGAGGGWFTIRLARRVGPNGTVYAEDIQPEMIEAITFRVAREGLHNVVTILGTPDDPRLPDGAVDAVLVVDTYNELEAPVKLLRNVARALAPKGRIGVVDFTKEGWGGPGPAMDERVDPSRIEQDAQAAGLRVWKQETFLRYQYLLILGR
jgi:ubiquinone/menaquinone biosynthesis C-methylase UbiE